MTSSRAGIMPMLALLALAGALAWWGWVKTHPANDWASKLLTAPVTQGGLVENVSATGSVTAQTGAQVKIGSQITGRIKRLYADVGSHVKAGQVIAELDLPDIQAQLNQAIANLAAARTKENSRLFEDAKARKSENAKSGRCDKEPRNGGSQEGGLPGLLDSSSKSRFPFAFSLFRAFASSNSRPFPR